MIWFIMLGRGRGHVLTQALPGESLGFFLLRTNELLLWPSGISTDLGRNRLRVRVLAVSPLILSIVPPI